MGEIDFQCKNDKGLKNWKNITPPFLLRRPAPAPYLHPFFKFFIFPPASGGNQNLSPLRKY